MRVITVRAAIQKMANQMVAATVQWAMSGAASSGLNMGRTAKSHFPESSCGPNTALWRVTCQFVAFFRPAKQDIQHLS
jgi:hypothetical protein